MQVLQKAVTKTIILEIQLEALDRNRRNYKSYWFDLVDSRAERRFPI